MLPEKITLNQVRHWRNATSSAFSSEYPKLFLESPLDEQEYIHLLALAITFISRGDFNVRLLGYRIILRYSLTTKDFEPLLDYSRQFQIAPLALLIRKREFAEEQPGLADLMTDSYLEANFKDPEGRTKTLAQLKLQTFANTHRNTLIVAPTSYGKSELIFTRALETMSKGAARVCILVPTKALITQTQRSLYHYQRRNETRYRVITHPDAFNGELSFIAVLTQERLLGLMTKNPTLTFTEVLVDEAQNLLEAGARSETLSSTLYIAKSRNPSTHISYYSPFLNDTSETQHLGSIDSEIRSFVVDEKLKSEIFIAVTEQEISIYDQFLGKNLDVHPSNFRKEHEAEFIRALGKGSTLVYCNRPRDVEQIAVELAEGTSTVLASPTGQRASKALSEFFHPEYKLVSLLQHGVAYHHGKMPEIVRQYVEALFNSSDPMEERYLACTSTLLEGINTPADRLVVLTPKRGRRQLTPAAFRNLVGRIGRFNRIFDETDPRLDLLMPCIWLIDSRFSHKGYDPFKFLQKTVSATVDSRPDVQNPLLEKGPTGEKRDDAVERLLNIEELNLAIQTNRQVRKVSSDIGRKCFSWGVYEIDIFASEATLQANYLDARNSNTQISSAQDAIDLFSSIFLHETQLSQKIESSTRRFFETIKENQSARRFHALHLDWRIQGLSFREKILRQVSFWLSKQNPDLIFVGSAWGEVRKYPNQHVPTYIDRRQKSFSDLVNFAIVRIKEESDFLDQTLMKFLELLHDLKLFDEDFFLRMKYGTTDPKAITLMQNGFSFELARTVIALSGFEEYLFINEESGNVELAPGALTWLRSFDELNELLLFEFETLGAEA